MPQKWSIFDQKVAARKLRQTWVMRGGGNESGDLCLLDKSWQSPRRKYNELRQKGVVSFVHTIDVSFYVYMSLRTRTSKVYYNLVCSAL